MTDPGRREALSGPGAGTDARVGRSGARAFWALLAALVLLGHGLVISFANDDAFISFRYAKNWLEGHGLVFNPGERVEGYTNFLWTILVGTFMRFGVEPLLASRALGFLASAGTLVLASRISRDLAPGFRRVRLAPLFLAASSPFAYWTFAGLETPLVTFLLLLAVERAIATAARDGRAGALAPLSVSVPLGLLALTRPEGVLFFALFLAQRLVAGLRARRLFVRDEALFVAGFLLVYGPYFLWRFSYYGYLFPNTFYLRRGESLAQDFDLWKNGVLYVAGFFRDGGGALLLTPLLFLGAGAGRSSGVARALAALTVVWAVYVVSVGGDAKILYRFFVPVLPLLFLVVEAALARIVAAVAFEGTASRAAAPWVAARRVGLALGALGIAALLAMPSLSPPEKYRTDRTFFAMLAEGGRWLARNAPPDATVACFAVGALPYYSSLTTYDLLGVTDTHIAHGPLLAGQMTGHAKTDWEYVLAKHPTFIFPMGDPDLSRAGYEYAPISVNVGGEVLSLRAWRRAAR